MSRTSLLTRVHLDPYIVAIMATVGLASILPARGMGAVVAGHAATIAVGLLFFLYGARISPAAALAGARHWRLHLVVLISTFVLFPLLGLASALLVPTVLTPSLYVGMLFLCTLPSTVQSSIAFTSIGRGNVAAAICSASFSNMIGILLTPLLVALLLTNRTGGFSTGAVRDIMLQLLVPFALGQLLRRWIGGWVERKKKHLMLVDRGSILLVVYTAFSEGVVAGIWHQLSLARLLALVAVNVLLLALVLVLTTVASRRLRFSREDEVTIVFCGSKKSLASGLPMATVLFAGHDVGLIVLPLMLFHQIQLIVCAALARRYASRAVQEPAMSSVA